MLYFHPHIYRVAVARSQSRIACGSHSWACLAGAVYPARLSRFTRRSQIPLPVLAPRGHQQKSIAFAMLVLLFPPYSQYVSGYLLIHQGAENHSQDGFRGLRRTPPFSPRGGTKTKNRLTAVLFWSQVPNLNSCLKTHSKSIFQLTSVVYIV